jgi:hypothetical protein
MNTLFLYCAAIGGTILLAQFLMLLFGVGSDGDVDHGDVGHDQGAFLKLFSLQTIAAFATFFGLVGLGTEGLGWSPLSVTVAAGSAGTVALLFVAKLMQSLSRLQSQGNLDLRNAVGTTGSVYLRIPAAGDGHGRVMLQVQGRQVECRAISRADEIATGARVHVVERTDDDTLVVEPIH